MGDLTKEKAMEGIFAGLEQLNRNTVSSVNYTRGRTYDYDQYERMRFVNTPSPCILLSTKSPS